MTVPVKCLAMASFMNLSPMSDDRVPITRVVVLLVAASIMYTIHLALARLVFSPIAKFPGPKLAAFSFWYEFFYDVVQGGQYTWKIEELHKKYGKYVVLNHVPFDFLLAGVEYP